MQGVSKMLEQTLGVSSLQQNIKKTVNTGICPQVQTHILPVSVLYIFICGDTSKPQRIHLQFKMNRHFVNAFLCPSNVLQPSPGPLKWRDSPLADMSLRALIFVEGILKFVVNCDLINTYNLTVIKQGTCIVNVFCPL